MKDKKKTTVSILKKDNINTLQDWDKLTTTEKGKISTSIFNTISEQFKNKDLVRKYIRKLLNDANISNKKSETTVNTIINPFSNEVKFDKVTEIGNDLGLCCELSYKDKYIVILVMRRALSAKYIIINEPSFGIWIYEQGPLVNSKDLHIKSISDNKFCSGYKPIVFTPEELYDDWDFMIKHQQDNTLKHIFVDKIKASRFVKFLDNYYSKDQIVEDKVIKQINKKYGKRTKPSSKKSK